jgi:hypothetical protein
MMNNKKKAILAGVLFLVVFMLGALLSQAAGGGTYEKRCFQIPNCPMTQEGCSGDMVTYSFCTIYCTIATIPLQEIIKECEMPDP